MNSLQKAIDCLGTQLTLAEKLQGNVKQQHISYWLKNRVPAERCREIEEATNGVVTVADLRPDIFGKPEQAA